MHRIAPLLFVILAAGSSARAAEVPGLQGSTLAALAAEISGESAKRNLDAITVFHRTRAGSQYRRAAEHVRSRLHEYGFEDAEIIELAADGRTFYGTQRSRPAWDVSFAELWEVNADGRRVRRLADWEAMPLSLAQDSVSGDAVAELVDIGAGTKPEHYRDLDVSGKLVLTESQPGDVAELAVGRYGAAGVVSYAPNQRSAWWKEDDRLVRWGHVGAFLPEQARTFGFMISLGEARALRARLEAGEVVRLSATVRAGHGDGSYDLVSARIPGVDPKVGHEEILFTCHLDHPRPGANDNASGCVAILEVARALKALIADGRLPRPRRTLAFLWPPEIEGTLAYLNGLPERADRIRANLHLDMVGGGPKTKAVFRVSGGPLSLTSFVGDLGHAVAGFVNAETLAHASGAAAEFPLVAPEGGKEPLLAQLEGLSMGSDHDVLMEGSWRVPGIYLHDWPDRYIHTNFDRPAHIDPTKLKRAAFIAAASAWSLANLGADQVPDLLQLMRRQALLRAAELLSRFADLTPAEGAAAARVHWLAERGRIDSINTFAALTGSQRVDAMAFIDSLAALTEAPTGESGPVADGDVVYRRAATPKGPMHAFGYSYLEDRLGAEAAAQLSLPRAQAYEALNLVDGRRSVADIGDWLIAEFGPVDRAAVAAYLAALADIEVLVRP